MRVKGKVAIVTGAGGGLGAETARVLAREGAKVIVTDVSDAAAQVATEVGGHFVKHDVTSEKDWQAVIDKALQAHGQIDVLVNSAGIEGDISKSGLNTSLAEWRRVIGVNLDGTFLGCRMVIGHMLEKGTGSIINIASMVSYFASPTTLAYGASKAAVQQLSQSFALIGTANGKKVRSNSVHPGVIRTRMTDNILSQFGKLGNMTAAQVEADFVKAVPMGARGVPADVANLILFLASDESAYVTGSAFQVDGGWHLVSAG